MNRKPRYIELLAPARDAEVAFEAINHGADAVYMGPERFGARAMAGNSVDDIGRVCDYAHKFGARVYATVNTIVYDDELASVERLIRELYAAQVDALIVQDLGVLRLDIPPIALHASTQCDIRTPEKAKFLQELGFSQLVMARELSLKEICAISSTVKVPLEAFVHGALCVSYSGRCALSQAVKGRSANRGQCAQMCRLPYDLVDDRGNVLVEAKHLLSLRDLNQSHRLGDMLEAGVSSFKIEGRLKDVSYVKNVVAHYRQLIDGHIASSDGRYRRLSHGTSHLTFAPDVYRSFNRSFTNYFIDGRTKASRMACLDSPKSQGQPVGTVVASRGKSLEVASPLVFANGDGLSYYDDHGVFRGMRVNVARGQNLILREPVAIKAGTKLFRTADKAFDDIMSRPSAERRIAVDMKLYSATRALVLKISDERGNSVVHSMTVDCLDEARQGQGSRQQEILSKLGDTIYYARSCVSEVGEKFVPVSFLAQLRRETVALLDRANAMKYMRELRRKENLDAAVPCSELGHADNVANELSATLYRDHGALSIVPAFEVSELDGCDAMQGRPVLMHTRYCIRRELGACRMKPDAKKLPHKLFLRGSDVMLEVICDCAACEMRLLRADNAE